MTRALRTAALRCGAILLGCVVLATIPIALGGCKRQPMLSTLSGGQQQASEQGPKYFWPLTNLPAPDDKVIGRRPISMKIDNFPDARPQSGLIDADIVYEIIVEGSMTRFHALFHSTLPTMAGPMRSARSTDGWVVDQWGSYLIFSGATPETIGELTYNGVEMITESSDGRIFERTTDRIAPHNLYVNLDNIPEVAPEFGIDVSSWQTRSLAFVPYKKDGTADEAAQTTAPNAATSSDGATAPTETDATSSTTATPTARTIAIPFGGVNAYWEYDPASQTYLRFQDGVEHVDRETGRQISANNVVVLWADYFAMERGLASLFSGGIRIDGNWTTTGGVPIELRTVDGKPITFQCGNTWFEVVYEGTEVVVE